MSTWWNKNVENRLEDFKSWIGDYNKESKVYCRKYVATAGYKEILDCGCGVATEYYGYQHDKYDIDYTGLDSCDYLIKFNREQGIKMIESDLEHPLKLKSNSYECVYCREVLEHLPYYENAVTGFIKAAKKEVLLVWFIKPDSEPDEINYWKEEDLYHNKYNVEKLESFILANPKVKEIFWKSINEKENVLHIKLT